MNNITQETLGHTLESLPITIKWVIVSILLISVATMGLAKWIGFDECRKLWKGLRLKRNKQEMAIYIDTPFKGAECFQRTTIRGRSPAGSDVWVVVHPMKYQSYWVQPRVSVNADGSWSVTAYIGEPGSTKGSHYEIRAIANPKQPLDKASALPFWPEAEYQSDIVEIVRA